MKRNSKQFLAVFMAASMAVAPVSGVYAQDQNAAVENAVNDNGQDSSAAEQTENDVLADKSQEAGKDTGINQGVVENTQNTTTVQGSVKTENKEKPAEKNQIAVQNTQKDGTASQTETADEDEDFDLTDVSGAAGGLADGEYSVDADHFSFAGGSGKVTISCQKVIVKDGKAKAWIYISSAKYDKVWVKVNGKQTRYEAKSEGRGVVFQIPVDLNKQMKIMTHTMAMSSGKNIEYTINIAIPENAVPSTPSIPEQTVITGISFNEGTELSMKAGEVQKLTPQFIPALSAG